MPKAGNGTVVSHAAQMRGRSWSFSSTEKPVVKELVDVVDIVLGILQIHLNCICSLESEGENMPTIPQTTKVQELS